MSGLFKHSTTDPGECLQFTLKIELLFFRSGYFNIAPQRTVGSAVGSQCNSVIVFQVGLFQHSTTADTGGGVFQVLTMHSFLWLII